MRWHAPVPADGPRSGAALMRRHRDRLVDILRRVQIPEPEAVLERYPHQFSGGQRQRLMIAGALACSPRAGHRRRADHGARRHDAAADPEASEIACGRVRRRRCCSSRMIWAWWRSSATTSRVMYAGQTVESGPTRSGPRRPQAPLHAGAAQPAIPSAAKALIGIPGVVPSPLNPPPGCRFAPRCPHAIEYCRRRPAHLVADGPDRLVNCRLAEPAAAGCGMSLVEPIAGGARRRRRARRRQARCLRKPVPPVRAVAGVSLALQRGRNPRARRRIRLRQDDARAHAARHPARDRRRDPARRPRGQRRAAAGGARAQARRSSTSTRTPAPRSIRGGASAASSRRGSS